MADKTGGLGNSDSVSVEGKYAFASEEELKNRVDTGYSDDKNPGKNPTHFSQIAPERSGKNANEPDTGQNRSGDFKFSKGV